MMKEAIRQALGQALDQLAEQQGYDGQCEVQVSECRDKQHGDLASNVALIYGPRMGLTGQACAQATIDCLPKIPGVAEVSLAGPGFINFRLELGQHHRVLQAVLQSEGQYGNSQVGAGQRIHIEYVSANPTGPLHVGHGRGAAYGACVSNLLTAVGYSVHREYYVNDAGRQMHILALSVWLRYLLRLQQSVDFPAKAYQGNYIDDIAADLVSEYADRYVVQAAEYQQGLEQACAAAGQVLMLESDAYLDAAIASMMKLLGEEACSMIRHKAHSVILSDIKEDLEQFGVSYQSWFSENDMVKARQVEHGIELLQERQCLYEQDGALWFRASDYGDEKDWVVRRSSGEYTYFASDIAYHLAKVETGAQVIDVFGADHHGYVPRIRAFLRALGKRDDQLEVHLVQFAVLWRGEEKVSMSTRKGDYITLRALREEVGRDAARYFYCMRSAAQHLDFDLELAKSQKHNNPVYTIQYAHARINNVCLEAEAKFGPLSIDRGLAGTACLTTECEIALLKQIAAYPDHIEQAADRREPHRLAYAIWQLARQLNSYYHETRICVEDQITREARLCLILSIKHCLAHGLALLGVSAPDRM